jgi:hypothetical protein
MYRVTQKGPPRVTLIFLIGSGGVAWVAMPTTIPCASQPCSFNLSLLGLNPGDSFSMHMHVTPTTIGTTAAVSSSSPPETVSTTITKYYG